MENPILKPGEFEAAGKAETPAEEVKPSVLADKAAEGFPEPDLLPFELKDGQEAAKVEKDSKGRPFDPNRFKADESGKPLRKEDGTFIRIYRKSEGTEVDDQFDQAARIAALWQIRIVGMLLDPDEAIPNDTFKRELEEAYALYFRANNMSITSPGVNLLFVAGSHLVETASKPKSKEKVKWIGSKIVAWIKSKRGK